MSMDKIDSIIFDMDGTLWDASGIYTEAWNRSLLENGVQRVLTHSEIAGMTGWEKNDILNHLLPHCPLEVHENVDKSVAEYSISLIPVLKGQLYAGVAEGLSRLSARYPLFVLSNCDAGVIDLFMDATGIGPFITAHIAHGENGKPKHQNMKTLINNHRLQLPIYVGDTQHDSEQCKKAGVPFVFVTYGFGQTEAYHRKFDTFSELSAHYLSLD